MTEPKPKSQAVMRRYQMVASGLCWDLCGKPRVNNWCCAEHIKRRREQQAKWRIRKRNVRRLAMLRYRASIAAREAQVIEGIARWAATS